MCFYLSPDSSTSRLTVAWGAQGLNSSKPWIKFEGRAGTNYHFAGDEHNNVRV